MDKLEQLPRYWPILYILDRISAETCHFFLQKNIFLSKVEAKFPVKYTFSKHEHGPYCIDIKADAKDLDTRGLISMKWDSSFNRWQFSIKEAGKVELKRLNADIPEKWFKKINNVLDRYHDYSITDLEKIVYKKYVKEKKETDGVLNNVRENIQKTLNQFKDYAPSYNLFLLSGSLEYCLLAIDNVEDNKDIVQRNYFISVIYDYVSKVVEIGSMVAQNPDCLNELDLRDEEDTFYLIQQICKEISDFPSLEEIDLSKFNNIPLSSRQ